jgi:hypothetical protein
MTYTQFLELERKDQSSLVLNKGLLLEERETASNQISLYQLFNLCVELRLHKPSDTIVSCNPIVFN